MAVEPPFYPPWLVHWTSSGKGPLGDARFMCLGWTFLFKDGALMVAAPDGVNVIQMAPEDTEQFMTVVRALDAGRFTPTFELREKTP